MGKCTSQTPSHDKQADFDMWIEQGTAKSKTNQEHVPLELDHINGDNKDNRLIDYVCSALTAMH